MFQVILFIFVVKAGFAAEDSKEQCRLDPHPSVEYRCLVEGTEDHRSCSAFEPAGTVVNPRCRQPNYRSTSLPRMQCIGREWDYIARCSPECGRVTPDGKGLVVGGHTVKRGELPWHAGIYKRTTSPYKQICGGSLISTNVVISAAHCFWSDIEKQLPAFQFAVAVGKVYRKWNNNLDEAQKSHVKAIHLPTRYQGASANFQEDIAMVIATQEFKYMTFIRPVCLSFEYSFDKQQLQAGNQGMVAGWGLTSATGNQPSKLQVVSLPYVEVDTCIANSPPSFREYITGDKICAGTQDSEKALCRGDSGGGLAFPTSEPARYQPVERFYLRGIVSTAPSSEQECNTEVYTSFTSILKHEHFIKQFWTESGQFKCQDGSFITASNLCDGARDCADGSDETAQVCSKKSCSSYLFQCAYGACVDKGAICNRVDECADGSDESVELCGRPTAKVNRTTFIVSNRCVLPPFPENGMYVVTNIAGAKPGEVYDLVTVNVTCLPGYHILGSSSIYCFLGRWPESMPECTNEFRSDYTYYPEAEGWFKVHPVPTDWRTAGLLCHFEGAELASPRKPEIKEVLRELVAKAVPKLQVYFSGVRQAFVVGDFFLKEPANTLQYDWEEDTIGLEKPQKCLVYSGDVVERDFNCDDALPYICYRHFSITDELTECGTIDKAYKLDSSTGHCYKLHDRPDTWVRAQKICRAEGSYLAIINSKDESYLLNEITRRSENIGNASVVIGFREWGRPGSWWTIHGQTLEEAGFEDWSEDDPKALRSEENTLVCGGFNDGKLRDVSCEEALPFICEKSVNSLSRNFIE